MTAAEHDELGALLARCFVRSRTPFGPGRSWSSARPELRVVARAGDRPVAHLAVLRRFLQVDGGAVLVGNYLTTLGRPAEADIDLLGELQMPIRALNATL